MSRITTSDWDNREHVELVNDSFTDFRFYGAELLYFPHPGPAHPLRRGRFRIDRTSVTHRRFNE